jgi:flagellin
MPLNITTNSAASAAGYYLEKNQKSLQTSLTRLASGKKIIAPYDDPGSLSVSMKLQASINRLSGAQNNIRNGISFLEVQDGILEAAGRVVDRMNELKGLAAQDPMKSSVDIASYNDEFGDLQVQLYQMSQQTFNGVSLFAIQNHLGSANSVFRDASTNNTVSIHTSADGGDGAKVSLHKAALLSALTITAATPATAAAWQTADNTAVFTFASADHSSTITLDQVSTAVLAKALENVASLRAQNGGTMSRLTFSSNVVAQMRTNMKAALGRIVDVDIAEESTELAKYNILVQASAAMLSQANSSTDVALMLLR